MLFYEDGTEIRVGDRIRHAGTEGIVETIIEGDDVARWDLEAPVFGVLRDDRINILIEPGSYDWEDVDFIGRGG